MEALIWYIADPEKRHYFTDNKTVIHTNSNKNSQSFVMYSNQYLKNDFNHSSVTIAKLKWMSPFGMSLILVLSDHNKPLPNNIMLHRPGSADYTANLIGFKSVLPLPVKFSI